MSLLITITIITILFGPVQTLFTFPSRCSTGSLLPEPLTSRIALRPHRALYNAARYTKSPPALCPPPGGGAAFFLFFSFPPGNRCVKPQKPNVGLNSQCRERVGHGWVHPLCHSHLQRWAEVGLHRVPAHVPRATRGALRLCFVSGLYFFYLLYDFFFLLFVFSFS